MQVAIIFVRSGFTSPIFIIRYIPINKNQLFLMAFLQA